MGTFVFYDQQNAIEFGIKPAIILEKLIYFTASNMVYGKNRFENKTWIYVQGGYETFVSDKYFPELTVNQFRYAITKLMKEDCVEVSNEYNNHAYDRTYWYSVNFKRFKDKILSKVDEIKKAKGIKNQSNQKPQQPKKAPVTTAPIESNEEAKANSGYIKETNELFNKAVEKFNSTESELMNIAKTAYNVNYKRAFKYDYTGWNFKTLLDLKSIVNKFNTKTAKKGFTKQSLLIELDWFFYTVFLEYKNQPQKFNPIYTNIQFDNHFNKLISNVKAGKYKKVYTSKEVLQLYNALKQTE